MEIRKRVAYLQGLTDGLKISDEQKEGQVLLEIIDVLNDIADEIEDIKTQQLEMENYMNAIDEDLHELEEDLLYDEDEEEEGYEFDEEDVLDSDYVEVECPECGDTVCFEASILDEDERIEVSCPNCDTVVFINDEEHEAEESEEKE